MDASTIAQPKKWQHTLIRASAGSGKTFQLSNRYLQLLLAGAAPETILAVTFTRKAAGEIFERIMQRLAGAAADEVKCRELAKFVSADLTRTRCRELLCQVTASLHRLRISTLDSFFSKVAGTSALEMGLPLHWRIVEPHLDQALRDEAIAAALAGESTSRLLTLLHLLAKGDVQRGISSLIRQTVNDLYGTFLETEPAAWQRLSPCKVPAEPEVQAALSRLEAYAYDDQRFQKAKEKDVAHFYAGDFEELLKSGLAAKVFAGETLYQKKPIGDEVIAYYEILLQSVKAHAINQLAAQTEATHDLLTQFHEQYRRLKQERGALRFDDITLWLAQHAHADEDRTMFRLDARLQHLLLDEFQDTSLAQWQVLRPLAQRITAAKQNNSFLCVGDTKQAIYGWRGGLAELFDAVEAELTHIVPQSLTTSYRSSPVVIEVVNRIFANMHLHPKLEKLEQPILSWLKRFEPHSTNKTDLPGYVTLETAPISRDEEADEEQHFLQFVADRIAAQYHHTPQHTIGVLTRSNDKLRQIIFLLRQRNVPASEEGGNPLVDSAAVELILSLLRLADHPGDSAAWHHVRTSPVAEPIAQQDGKSLRAEWVSERLRRELLNLGYGLAVETWCQLLAASADARDRLRLQQLIELAYAYQSESTLRPSDFIEYVEATKVSDPTTAAVRVMTVHQAKGLEFDVVFLPELDGSLRGQSPAYVVSRPQPAAPIDCVCRYANEQVQQLLPDRFQRMFAANLAGDVQEDMCVLYVALTRAIHALHMLIRPPKGNEKNLPKKYSGLLRAALCDDASPQAGLLFAQGDPQWHISTAAAKEVVPAVKPTWELPIIKLAPSLSQRRRGLQRESPSQLEGGDAGRNRRLFTWQDSHLQNALDRGTAIHAFFEQITWLPAKLPDEAFFLAALNRIPNFTHVTSEQRQSWCQQFQNSLTLPGVRNMLDRENYLAALPAAAAKLVAEADVEVHNEFPFATINETQMMQGRMDRVVLFKRDGKVIAADVLDYKTDIINDQPGATVVERVEYYRPQIMAYRATLQQRFALPPQAVFSALLFVHAGNVVRLAAESSTHSKTL
jgi:ATP-dependent helicase/nuclease subunit A